MCLQIVNFKQNELALKHILDFLPCFGPAIRELFTVTNRIFILYIVNIKLVFNLYTREIILVLLHFGFSFIHCF